MECTVHIGGARLITIRQLASLVQLFLLKAEDFSLAFLWNLNIKIKKKKKLLKNEAIRKLSSLNNK